MRLEFVRAHVVPLAHRARDAVQVRRHTRIGSVVDGG